MKRILVYGLVGLLAQMATAQVTIDRVVAVVNKNVITQSDWNAQERFQALMNDRPPEFVGHSAESLDRLVDQQLMREQIDHASFEPPTAEQVEAQVAKVRKQVAPVLDDEQWLALLARYSLSESSFSARVAAQLEVIHFVDLRFRPSVHVEPELVESYYQKTLVPALMKAGTAAEAVPPLKDVETKIRGILAEQELNEMLRTWLTSLRTQGRVKRLAETSPTMGTN